MNYKISADANYACSKCGKKYSATEDELDFSAESGSERGMGIETQYCAEYEHCCENCGNKIRLEFAAWIYPEGVFNSGQVSAHGAEVQSEKISLEHLPEYDAAIEAARLIKPLFQFRFDRFSEQFVDLWMSLYKQDRRLTLKYTYAAVAMTVIAVSARIYIESHSAQLSKPANGGIEDQISLLKETERNLVSIDAFIGKKQAEIIATQELLQGLEHRRAEIEPLVRANQEVVDAIFAYQQQELAKSAWKERGIGFALGILASLVASVIWHFVGRFRGT